MFCPVPTLLINHVYNEGIMWKNRGFYHDNPSQFVSAQRGFLKCKDWSQFDQFSIFYRWAQSCSALFNTFFFSVSTAGPLFCYLSRENQTSAYEASAWMLRNLCTTYYLVLLYSVWTPALRRGVYLSLFTCLCLTLCAPHCRGPFLCSFLICFINDDMAKKGLTIVISYTYWSIIFPHCIIGCSLAHLPCPFFIFWYNLWLRILPQLFRVSQSFLKRF